MDAQYIYNLIPTGQENAIHLDNIAKSLGVSPRYAKKLVRDARMEGLAICSGDCGYWIASNEEEQELFIKRLRKQGYERLKTAKAVNNTLKDNKGVTGANNKD